MKPRSSFALAGLLVAVVGGLAWLANTHQAKDAGEGDPITSLEFSGFAAGMVRSTNLIGVGAWSKPVKDKAGYILRGRLLVFDMPRYPGWQGNAPVYLELQNLSPRTDKALAVYFDPGDGLECEMYDAHGNVANSTAHLVGYTGGSLPYTRQYWAMVPFDGSVRLRMDPPSVWYSPGSTPGSKGLIIQFGYNQRWTIPSDDSRNYFLSGNFSPPTYHPSPPDSQIWEGKLELPAVRIAVPQ